MTGPSPTAVNSPKEERFTADAASRDPSGRWVFKDWPLLPTTGWNGTGRNRQERIALHHSLPVFAAIDGASDSHALIGALARTLTCRGEPAMLRIEHLQQPWFHLINGSALIPGSSTVPRVECDGHAT